MASKYPPFERVTAAKLRVGDRILIREARTDQLRVDGFDDHPWQDAPTFPTGIHTITDIRSELHHRYGGRGRASRYYVIWVDGFHPSAHVPLAATVSHVLRLNRVKEDA